MRNKYNYHYFVNTDIMEKPRIIIFWINALIGHRHTDFLHKGSLRLNSQEHLNVIPSRYAVCSSHDPSLKQQNPLHFK